MALCLLSGIGKKAQRLPAEGKLGQRSSCLAFDKLLT